LWSHSEQLKKIPHTLQVISSTFAAAQTLVDLETEQATSTAELRNEKEVDDLSLAYGKGATGRSMATGGSKAIKDLEKEQKTCQTQMIRDGLDTALLDMVKLAKPQTNSCSLIIVSP